MIVFPSWTDGLTAVKQWDLPDPKEQPIAYRKVLLRHQQEGGVSEDGSRVMVSSHLRRSMCRRMARL